MKNSSGDIAELSFYKSDTTGTWIGIDFGENNSTKIDRIDFCPRTDTDFIIPGNEYELFYWNNGWNSLGIKTATHYFLTYNNVPEGALLWLYCHSGGKEERPFLYNKGKQIWW